MIKNIRHRSSFKRERREWNVIGRQAGSAVDDSTVAPPSGTAVFLGGGRPDPPERPPEGGGEPDPPEATAREGKRSQRQSIFSGKSSFNYNFFG